jgi:hypothetical protein
MSFTLVLNAQNVIETENNTYQYDFIKGIFSIPEDNEVMQMFSCLIVFIISHLPIKIINSFYTFLLVIPQKHIYNYYS